MASGSAVASSDRKPASRRRIPDRCARSSSFSASFSRCRRRIPSSRSRPTTRGSAPNRRRQSASDRITTRGAPWPSSVGSKFRPSRGSTPRREKKLAVTRPTRRPVNRPGPTSTATTEISSRSISAVWHVNSMAGVSVSAWRRPRATSNNASTPSWPPMAQPTCAVAVSIPRISIARPSPRPPRRCRAAASSGLPP